MGTPSDAIIRLKVTALLALAAKRRWRVTPGEAEVLVARNGLTEAARSLARRPTNPIFWLLWRGRQLFRQG
jgi:hypothetical protein